jgi:hypothetical protein
MDFPSWAVKAPLTFIAAFRHALIFTLPSSLARRFRF